MSWLKVVRVLVRGVEIMLREQGAGLDLLWAHGMMSSMQAEDALAPQRWLQAPAGVRLRRYDARGHGASSASADPASFTWAALGSDMLALAGGARFIAGGWSMGAATALHAACQAPAQVAGLILLQAPRAWEDRVGAARVYQRALRLEHVQPPGGHPCRTRLFAAAAVSDLPPREQLARLAIPALVIGVPGEPEHPLAAARALHALLPRATWLAASSPADPVIAEAIARFAAGVVCG